MLWDVMGLNSLLSLLGAVEPH